MHKQALEYGGSDGDFFQAGYEAVLRNEAVPFDMVDMYWAQGYCAGLYKIQQEIE